MWRIEFESGRFLPFLPEESQANPGVYGFELASWLAAALARRQLVTGYPLGEDWGWLLEYTTDGIALTLGCASVCDEGDGYRGLPLTWSIGIEARRSLQQKIRGVPVEPALQQLATAVTACLEAEGIDWRQA